MKKLKLFMASLLAAGSLMLAPAWVLADQSSLITDPVCSTASTLPGCSGASNAQCVNATDKAACEANAAHLEAQNGYLTLLVDTFIYAGAIVATIFLFIGGIRYVTSTGDPARITSAKNTVQYAIIGLVIAILARLLVGYVIGVFT
ncbi:MAG TPA: pilin [Candidatus Saccharimonadales bacterium]|nr:pilin [Candidatus Saccharimonadales bacterium]